MQRYHAGIAGWLEATGALYAPAENQLQTTPGFRSGLVDDYFGTAHAKGTHLDELMRK